MRDKYQPGDWITGPYWAAQAQILNISPHPEHAYDRVTLHIPKQRKTIEFVFTSDDWRLVSRAPDSNKGVNDFSGNASRFALGIEAHRMRLVHSIDPYMALNTSRVDPLPHQFEAVYDYLLRRPVVRALLAHDAGAGKTIMAGMLIKELKHRQGVQRILIVTPAGLTVQWRRELITKFGEDFRLVSREFMESNRYDALDVWREINCAITSIDFAKQRHFRQALETSEWDLVIVDEAHKMAAYSDLGSISIRRTQAYELGEVLSRHTTHLLLMTATPHKGDPENYRLLINLIDPQWGDANAYAPGANPVVLRRTKEEMLKADDTPLYPERIVEPVEYTLSIQEGALLDKVQQFIRERYDIASAAGRHRAAFALLTLDRRLASSPYALHESLKRMRESLEDQIQRRRIIEIIESDEGEWGEWEELPEDERWQHEDRGEQEVATLIVPRNLKAELRKIDALIQDTNQIIRQGYQEKLKELRKACDEWVGRQGEQLIIFTEFKDTLDYLCENLHDWGYTTTQIHGGMALKDRRKAEREFWDREAQILVATEAAGEGINLQCCHVMINFDIPWNPCRLEQRMGRIHRYGQKADRVYIFNLVATNTMEGEVKLALLRKMKRMKADLGDRVFNVVGEMLWGRELRETLERIALGETDAVEDAHRAIDRAGETARTVIETERQEAIQAAPLDVMHFRREQATFRAYRLSPELAEKFFRHAIPFVGGAFREFETEGTDGNSYTSLRVSIPFNLFNCRQPDLTVSFWPQVCSDDDADPEAILFIAPGHWLFEALVERVIALCSPDIQQGSVFFDLHPEDSKPYLVWFVTSYILDGHGQRISDLLAAVKHQADAERVIQLPTEVLDGFDVEYGADNEIAIRQAEILIAAHEEVVGQCVDTILLPELQRKRARRVETIDHDRQYLENGLSALAEAFNSAALDAYAAGDNEQGDRNEDRRAATLERLQMLKADMDAAEHLLLVAPEVLGTALVLPSSLDIEAHPSGGRVMRTDRAVELAAMQAVMAYEERQGRYPRDVSQGHSWDIESDDSEGITVRYIEVKGRGPADAAEVWLTEPEWEAARRLGDHHWLYVVRLSDGMIWMIRNPYDKLKPKELKRWVLRMNALEGFAETTSIE